MFERIRLRMLRNHDSHFQGDQINLPAALAQQYLAVGVAERVSPPGPGENKAIAAAPENKALAACDGIRPDFCGACEQLPAPGGTTPLQPAREAKPRKPRGRKS